MKTAQWFWLAAICGILSLPASSASGLIFQPVDNDAGQTNAHEDQLYADATRAINESRWSDAESLLNQVIDQHGRRADGAMYWKAYVENKEGRSSEALKTCSDLRQAYPNSNWLKECSALEIEVRGKGGSPVQPQAEQDEDLKLLALNSLMQSGDVNALPILQQILEGQQSERLKERALFVLAQDQSKPAQDLFGQIVRGEKDPNLQLKAVQLLAVTKGSHSADTLADIYAKSSNQSVKKAVLNSYLVMGAPDKLVQVAQHEPDPELARHAVYELGAMGAVTQLSTMYQSTSNKDVKSAIINAFVAAGGKGANALNAIASSEQDPDLRRKAIRNMGVAGGSSAIPTLLSIYSKSTDEESKKAVLDALFVAGDAHDLVALARSEKDPSAKRDIVGKLAVMHNKEAADYMMELLNK
ncbi:HEAT repeat domain-containing protein [Alloacidobacterium sp.]|uniref:HEAT repeat domain-containing protein n=1 Tax=Alloacidobacterium sp. TaxID=2951999 RepID=UPI002D26AF5D|nr:HEAT repeat domain-containing protein [Alloacidobacterium sp.]HYK35866.1 HEAT repeat domain-containing protein [Alloacidobacterium sp.]